MSKETECRSSGIRAEFFNSHVLIATVDLPYSSLLSIKFIT
jgi:hypothetical protein